MLKRIWQWLKRLFKQILGIKTPYQPSMPTVRDEPLDDTACENFFMQLLEGVHQGWSRGQVKGFLLSKSISEADLVRWLQEFGRKLLESPEPDQELLQRLVRLGELDCGEIGKVAYEIGIQRLRREPKAKVSEDDFQVTEAEDWFKQGYKQYEARNFEEAIASLAEDWFNQGEQQYYAGNFEEAIVSYDQALTVKPDFHEAWFNRGVVLENLGRYEEAISSFDQALTVKPDKHEAWFNRGVVLGNLGRYEEAIASYDQALKVKPDDHDAWYNRGISLGHLGRDEEAIASFDQALTVKPDKHDAWNGRGISLGNLGRYEEAIASYDQALKVKPDLHEACYNRGVALRNLGRYEEAIASYDQALKVKPDKHDAWNGRGNALLNLGRYEEAIASYDQALKVKPDYHYAWLNRGAALNKLGQLEDAIASYDQALEIKPDKHEAWIGRGITAVNSVACNQLLAFLSAIARENPALNQRGYEGSLATYEAGLDYCHQDTHPEGWGMLHQAIGYAHYFQGKQAPNPRHYWRKAVNEYNKALKTLTPEAFPQLHLEVLQDLIEAYLSLGQIPEAEESKRLGTDLLKRLLDEPNLSDWNKKQLALKFVGFNQLTVDIYVQNGQLIEALETAEDGKNSCLTWLLSGFSNDTSPKYPEIQQLLNPTTVAVYWHISPYALHIFILRHDALEPIAINTPKSTDIEELPKSVRCQRDFETWVKEWNQQYQESRKGKTPLSSPIQEDNPENSDSPPQPSWREQLPEMLTKLGEILNIPAILSELTPNPESSSAIQNLILIPHRDLHRFPLHALFPSNVRITYLPSAQVGLNLQELLAKAELKSPTNNLSVANLLSVEHPNSENLLPLPFAEIESEIICRMFSNPTRITTEQANKDAVEKALQQPHHIFHFTGHGSYNFNDPKLSALALTGTERLTLAEIISLPLKGYQLVSLSACETAITGNQTITTEYAGLVSGFLRQGVLNVVTTLWTVESAASALVMIKFYNLLKTKSAVEALAEATQWLRNLTVEQLTNMYQAERANLPEDEATIRPFLRMELSNLSRMEASTKLYDHPYYWAAFTITGAADILPTAQVAVK